MNQFFFQELERKIAEFHCREDTILYPSCFDANAGLFEAILTENDAVLSDELNHASIIDGIRLCKAKKFRYKHKDMAGTFFKNKLTVVIVGENLLHVTLLQIWKKSLKRRVILV